VNARIRALTVALLISVALAAPAETYHVLPDGTGDFATIQAAIDASSDGDVVILGSGVFMGEGNRNIDFLGKTITVRSESGHPEDCVVDCYEWGSKWWLRGFLFLSGEGPSSVLDGVTVRNASMYGTHSAGSAGAIYCTASPTISNCIVEDGLVGGRGAGFYCSGAGCAPHISNCVIRRNTVKQTFVAGAYGGGVYCANGAAPTFEDCEIVENFADAIDYTYAAHGAGVCCFSDASPIFLRCRIVGNHSEGGGGGVNTHAGGSEFTGCIIAGNTSRPSAGFPAAIAAGVSASFRACTIVDHENPWGCIWIAAGSDIVFENSIIAFNGVPFWPDQTSDVVTLSCCDMFGNVGGDWAYGLAGQLGVRGNICEDPLFCDYALGDYEIQEDSPCVAYSEPNPSCDSIGAFGVGCPGSTVAESMTWGRVKAMYR
jgi:hypothetical protein